MVRINWDLYLNRLLAREGGLADRHISADPGGLTNYGITQATFTRKGYGGSVRDITPSQAKEFYLKEVIEREKLEGRYGESPWLCEFMLDAIVHHGPKRPIEFLQTAINCCLNQNKLAVDGKWGAKTQAALQKTLNEYAAFTQLKAAIKAARYIYLLTRGHASKNPGWFRRVAEL